LITWLDQATARDLAQLREVAELYYARFDAQLERRLAEFKGELRREMLGGQAALQQEMLEGQGAFRQEMLDRLAVFRQEVEQGLAAVRVEMAAQRSELIKWMFIFWAGTILPLGGLILSIAKL